MRLTLFGYELILQKACSCDRQVKEPALHSPDHCKTVNSLPSIKEAVEKKRPIEKCFYKGKRCFTREEAAEEAEATRVPHIRIYACEFSEPDKPTHWHLTHKKPNKF